MFDYPFLHTVIDGFLPDSQARSMLYKFPLMNNVNWQHVRHWNEDKWVMGNKKFMHPDLAQALREFEEPPFIQRLEQITGIPGLIADLLPAGGLYMTKRGGFLNMHTDATAHPYQPNWRRRLNVIIYLNEWWLPHWGGELQLWNKDMTRCEKSIAPAFNRAIIFECGLHSWHGYPEPLDCPPQVSRKAIALYYFTVDKNPVYRETLYHPLPGASRRKKLAMGLDQVALKIQAQMRRWLNVKF